MNRELGIDLGASSTFIYLKGKGIVLREPSVVALEANTFKLVAAGTEANLIRGKLPGSVSIVQPVSDEINDYTTTVELLTNLFKKMKKYGISVNKPSVLCSISCGADENRRASLEDAFLQAGCKKIKLIAIPYVAAIGAKLDIDSDTPCMIVDIGGGTSEIAVLKNSNIINAVSINVAGKMFSNALISYIRHKHSIYVSGRTIELLKKTYGTVNEKHNRGNAVVHGRHYSTGLPATVEISSPEIRCILSKQIAKIAEQILMTLDEIEGSCVESIQKNGITISGGSAMLDGIDMLLSEYTGIEVKCASSPLDCVADGLGFLIDNELVKI